MRHASTSWHRVGLGRRRPTRGVRRVSQCSGIGTNLRAGAEVTQTWNKPDSRRSARTQGSGYGTIKGCGDRRSHAPLAVPDVGHSRREPRLRGRSSIGVRRAGSAPSLRPWRGPLSTTLFLMSMTGGQVPGVASNIVLARAGSTRRGGPSGSCVGTLSVCEWWWHQGEAHLATGQRRQPVGCVVFDRPDELSAAS